VNRMDATVPRSRTNAEGILSGRNSRHNVRSSKDKRQKRRRNHNGALGCYVA
jgi:hypothetical protein